MGKKPSSYWKEDDSTWIPKLPYPVEVIAAFRRLIDAMRRYSVKGGNLGRYEKLETEGVRFVKACEINRSVAQTVLNDLIFRVCPNIPDKDQETLHNVS